MVVEFPKLTTAPAVALVLRSLKSLTLEAVPPIVTAPVRLLACVDRSISVAPAEEVRVVVPATVKAPVCVNPPVPLTPPAPVMTVKLPPIDDVPKISALASVTATALAPLLFKLTAPIKLFKAWVNVIEAPPALMLLVPVTVNPADWLTAPLLDVAAKFPPTVPCPRFSAPVEITVKFPAAILSVPSVSALASVTATALAPVFVKLTAPMKLLAA